MAGALLGATTANADTKIDDTHVRVEAGDTVSSIANKYGTDVSTIASASNLSDANKIFVGDILVLTPEAQQPTTNNVQTPVANQAQPASQATVNTQPVQNQPVQSQATVQQSTPVQAQPATSAVSGSEQSAKEWIASRESGGSYGATNGRYVGRYQLDASYLNGDYSEANQERVAQQYVTNRYGSWVNAQSFWQSHGWY